MSRSGEIQPRQHGQSSLHSEESSLSHRGSECSSQPSHFSSSLTTCSPHQVQSPTTLTPAMMPHPLDNRLHPFPVGQPLFTYKEVEVMCELIVSRRESELREKLEAELQAKLSQQYEELVKCAYEIRKWQEQPHDSPDA